jgi:1-acyl-sn-glycerol-3-phosphate acyltransferase
LLIGYGRLEIVIVIAAALGLDAFWSLGLLGWLGIPINLMNNIFILFVFGMGADYAIYVASSFLGRYLNPREELGVAGGAAALSALTGIGAFGTLVAARHPAMRSIGITASIVLVIGLLVASVVLPLAMRVLLWKNGRHGTPTLRTLACGLVFAGFFASAFLFCRWGILPWLRLRFPDDPTARRKAVQAFLRASSRVLLNSIPYGKRLYLNAGAAVFAKPAFIVCNHQSVIDILCALALPVNIRMVVKPRIWNSFFIGPVVREAGFILDEGTKAEAVFALAQEGLREGDFPLFFPEATPSESGSIGPFEEGAFEACVKAGAEILPVVMCETRSCIPPSAFWIGDHRLVVSVMPPIPVGGKEPGELAREAGILMAGEYEKNLALACDGPEFFKRVKGRYRYLGPRVERAVARRLRRDPLYREITGLIPRDAVVLDLGGDDGLLANILAAESTRCSVIGFVRDEETAAVARKAAVAPERTTYEAREKMAGGEFPSADAVLLSLEGSSPADPGEALLPQAMGRLKTGGRLVLREVAPARRENFLRLLERSDFIEIENFANVIIGEKRKAGPHGL